MLQDLDQSLASSFVLPHPSGALVNSVEDGGPADQAGLRPGDIIQNLNGTAVDSSATLPPRVAALKPGSDAVLGIWRDNAKRQLRVRVGELETHNAPAEPGSPALGRLGLAVQPLPRGERGPHGRAGLLVMASSGPAARAGISPGDVILAINGTALHDVGQFLALAARSGRHVALLVQRDAATVFVPLDLG